LEAAAPASEDGRPAKVVAGAARADVDIGDAPAEYVRVARDAVGVPLLPSEEVHAGERVVGPVVKLALDVGSDRRERNASVATWRSALGNCRSVAKV
jgi:hypothetical protein